MGSPGTERPACLLHTGIVTFPNELGHRTTCRAAACRPCHRPRGRPGLGTDAAHLQPGQGAVPGSDPAVNLGLWSGGPSKSCCVLLWVTPDAALSMPSCALCTALALATQSLAIVTLTSPRPAHLHSAGAVVQRSLGLSSANPCRAAGVSWEPEQRCSPGSPFGEDGGQ